MESFEEDDLLLVSPAEVSHSRKMRRLKKALSLPPPTADASLNPHSSLDSDPPNRERREFADDGGLDLLPSAPSHSHGKGFLDAMDVQHGSEEAATAHENAKSAKKKPWNLDSEAREDGGSKRHHNKDLQPPLETTADASLNLQRSLDPDPLDCERREFDDEDDLDPLFSAPVQPQEHGFINAMEEGIATYKKTKSVKKRLNLECEGGEEVTTTHKKKKKSGKTADNKKENKESIRQKARIEKEMEAHRQSIHAESQRLLRETRNASFTPVVVVQKPISSVLEKIRQRKLEMFSSFRGASKSDSSGGDTLLADNTQNHYFPNHQNDKTKEGTSLVVNSEKNESHVTHYPKTAPCNELNNGENNKITGNTFDDTLLSSLPSSSSNDDPTDDSSSEDNEKENVNPYPHGSFKMKSYKEDAFVKDFLDDEAEEEDASDQDAMRFGDDEDDDENDENGVLNDLIATGYEEDEIDHEKRNRLHQKWLEQQDDVETENVLQRLQCGMYHREESDEDINDDSNDMPLHDHVPSESIRKILKLSKHTLSHMFNDANDGHKTSDDEEAEQAVLRHDILREHEEEPSHISSIEDGKSKVSGLILKLNIAPETKKRAKQPSTSFETTFNCGNSNSSSKSSFVGRSMASSGQQKSPILRTFVFSRDDSNSRGSFSLNESASDVDQMENQHILREPRKINKKFKANMPQTIIEQKTDSGSSLFESISHLTMDTSCAVLEAAETRTSFQFSVFKAEKRVSKMVARSF